MASLNRSSILFVAILAILAQECLSLTSTNANCTKTSDCGDAKTHQVCINGNCGCEFGYQWDNDIFACTVRHCQEEKDCKFIWPNSVCSNSKSGMCVCGKKFHVDQPTQSCKPGAPKGAAHLTAHSAASFVVLGLTISLTMFSGLNRFLYQ